MVQAGYAELANQSDSCCNAEAAATTAQRMGYSEQEATSDAADGNLGVGCGNPGALAALKPGKRSSISAPARGLTRCSLRRNWVPTGGLSVSI